MEDPILAYMVWLSYTAETKKKLIRLFDIPRTGEVVVHVGEMQNGNISGVAKQDGHNPQDLQAITVEKLQALIGTEDTDFYHMVQHVLDNLDDLYYERLPEDKPETAPETVAVSVPTPAEPVPEAEFVPRDPEELLKKKEIEGVESLPDSNMLDNNLVEPKKKPYAKTKAAKAK